MRNIQKLALEMFKLYNGLSTPIMDNIFKLKTEDPYNLRQVSKFSRLIVKTVYHGTEIFYFGEQKYGKFRKLSKGNQNLEAQ